MDINTIVDDIIMSLVYNWVAQLFTEPTAEAETDNGDAIAEHIRVTLATNELIERFQNHDLEGFQKVANTENVDIPFYFVDMALQDGWSDMVLYLVKTHGCMPSLYSKQMAFIMGHMSIALWVDTHCRSLRNHTGIQSVHYKLKDGKWVWDVSIPEEARFGF